MGPALKVFPISERSLQDQENVGTNLSRPTHTLAAKARVQLEDVHTIISGLDQLTQGGRHHSQFSQSQPTFVERLLPAHLVGKQKFVHPVQPAWAGHVVAHQIESTRSIAHPRSVVLPAGRGALGKLADH